MFGRLAETPLYFDFLHLCLILIDLPTKYTNIAYIELDRALH